ncbi:DNA replication protein [Ruminiclostridium cellobioparum subsp. termitidis CT1112]|uniref:DNA replication protein n=1 Tax=Ruminiclostridium cellobioparum subsp. termitidis CT1112 TaxID=1195236 RepID=S0FFG0_RUMCE|nr:DNA replication protein [Ruminiclostridium cellobioparum subsp. termitidis CT1112]
MRIEQSIKEKLSYQEFLEILINDELMNRTNNGNHKRLQQAKFPQQKTIEEFNFNYQPSINRQTIYQLGSCDFVRKKENIAFIGPPGTGKTHLAISIGIKAVIQGYSVLFLTLTDMLEDLYMSRADNSFSQKLKKYTQCNLLIIDELGLKKLNQNSVDDFYEVIAKRYEQRSTVITSNKTFEEWGKILFDPVLATAILDRFVHHCNFIVINGDSYRMREREGILLNSEKRGRPRKLSLTEEQGDQYIEPEGGVGE